MSIVNLVPDSNRDFKGLKAFGKTKQLIHLTFIYSLSEEWAGVLFTELVYFENTVSALDCFPHPESLIKQGSKILYLPGQWCVSRCVAGQPSFTHLPAPA